MILMTINLYYHFKRIGDSILKADLLGLPVKKRVPYMKITPFEKSLFKNNLNAEIID
jgi:hypothetical protein